MTGVQVIPQPHFSMGLASFAAQDPGGWTSLREQALAYDRAGVDRLAISDHVVFGEDLDEYGRPEIGGRAGGVQSTGPDGHWLEPLTTLAYIAGFTERVRLSTNILLAALRRPVVLAKSAATLDILSNGRLDLGVGVGWQRAEYDAAGLPFARRGDLLNHTLDVCRTLWTQQVAHYDSAELSFADVHMMPKPLQPDGVPIWVSGTVNKRVQRIVRYGCGWIPWGPAADDIQTGIGEMKASVERAGGDPNTLQVTTALPAIRDSDGRLYRPRWVKSAHW
ncbi:TIGR03619 family F420-dependent LLM class oxidoreductase [Mycobacterium intracellulare]|uniref:TIGR03619 family F420-dependent LLM class oxidoreductase n=1 Tax=Mycobacterium intracellulare TaxID=1767 RepID=UPI0002EED1E5|nr:TIGR03619 family F420-dependent LLM class oxidoreductase [Mycobacterium intracellulare]MDM3899112.1 TIGR03619 family F420-dependent LLM class oxidoreductase [Mycobacterium intracellulare]UGT97542.1 TIGR03619 family F420-dependent LLM class oxidoreductase [Mycobacterium intracellulare]UGU07110.1 TIGR03619 family F420-dependent LLM class oxidoreductase [Mycobacterium intracellulare subsp. intracellulare]BCO55832.1 LLM class F420-dependent oxidoreductase [Mycobacterium intracellulare]BCO93095.